MKSKEIHYEMIVGSVWSMAKCKCINTANMGEWEVGNIEWWQINILIVCKARQVNAILHTGPYAGNSLAVLLHRLNPNTIEIVTLDSIIGFAWKFNYEIDQVV